MTTSPCELRQIDAAETEALAPQLCALLQHAVATASLGFWHPLDDTHASEYWRGVAAEVAQGQRWLFVALRDGEVVGTVQVALAAKQNASRRAEIQKLMVRQSARRLGIGRDLMRVAETQARQAGRTLLVLDTNTDSDAVHFYRSLGYSEVGSIPNYSTERDGSGRATTLFYKQLNAEA